MAAPRSRGPLQGRRPLGGVRPEGHEEPPAAREKGLSRAVVFCVLLAATATAAPGRHLRYAESSNRKVFAFIFGSKDTCRVIQRAAAPRFEFKQYQRRPWNAQYKGEPGDRVIRDVVFGRAGRPIHIVPTNDGKYVITFANRAPDGSAPAQDRVHHLEEKNYSEVADYGQLPVEALPRWPEMTRELKAKKKRPKTEPETLSYAFVTREVSGQLLVARQSEGQDGRGSELVCFAVAIPTGTVALPDEKTLLGLLDDEEPLFQAGAAWALGRTGKPDHAAAIRSALTQAREPAARAEIARALVRCGDAGARKMLRTLVGLPKEPAAQRAAAFALAQLPPKKADADALAASLVVEDAVTARLISLALSRLGPAALGALTKASRSSRPELRAAAATTLGRIDDVAAEKRLLTIGRDATASVQTAAAVALTSPPRAIFPENHGDFARALDTVRRTNNKKAARRLAMLAGHAKIHHEKVLQALVELTVSEPKAIWSLKRLTGENFKTSDDWKLWWKDRKKG